VFPLRQRRLTYLIAAHLTLYVVAFLASELSIHLPLGSEDLFTSYLVAMPDNVFAITHGVELQLLGIWFVLGTTKVEHRFAIWTVGTAILFWFPRSTFFSFTHLIELLVVICVVATLAGLRKYWWKPIWEPNDTQRSPPLQFSIWHLALIVTVTAILLAIRHLLGPLEMRLFEWDWRLVLSIAYGLTLFSLVLVACVWATLGRSRPVEPIIGVFLLQFMLSLSGVPISGVPQWQIVLTSLISNAIELSLIIASLLVVRSAGFRILPKRGAQNSNESECSMVASEVRDQFNAVVEQGKK
jgi:hypothetical protein